MGDRRLQKEYEEIAKLNQESERYGVQAHMVNSNLKHWKGQIKGPQDTPYEGGTFLIDIQIPDDYPYKPPKMQFETPIWHPNISSRTGAICLDILKDEWSPALTIRTALISLQALLCAPEPDDPQDAVVANQYRTDIEAYNQTAREWTERHARDYSIVFEEKLQRLTEMGFEESEARAALENAGGDENRAMDALLN